VDNQRRLSGLDEDLRSTAEDIFADAGELKAIEKVKAGLPAGDRRLLSLAKKADELGDKIAEKTAAELNLAQEAAGAS
jgi:hypothetical protein